MHFAIDETMTGRLRAADGDDERVAELIEEIEEGDNHLGKVDTDKAWEAIHRCLTDGELGFDNGEYPLNGAILGGEQFYDGEEYIVSLLTPEQVRDVAAAIGPITREQLRARYDAIDAEDYQDYLGDEDFDYTWSNFADVVAFFQGVAPTGNHVIFTVSQ
ncbi:hypothetical protein GCM10010435_68460 [Winogradskya consettensis]|uniref:DUF1877 family protein n=1 Tax=Winogradskya consettensis TaxID=113560 RepID=A0A919SKA4_9ACTN|nr:hypothetical protein Aco04nite_36310 [Actinoplanes consettensis]